MNRLLILTSFAVLAGCTTYKLWTESGSDQNTGIVQLSYDYRKFESPQVDERAAIEMARERCRDWGYTNAHRQAEDRQCVDGVETNCGKWQVTREYRCDKGEKK
jgi:hypothetical protein